jgi:hypothetical protein
MVEEYDAFRYLELEQESHMRSHLVLEKEKVENHLRESREMADKAGVDRVPLPLRKYAGYHLAYKDAAREFDFAKAEADCLEWQVACLILK